MHIYIAHDKNKDTMATLTAVAPVPVRLTLGPTVFTPSTVTHALNVPTFYQQKTQFWNMMSYLFSGPEQQPVWRQLSKKTHIQLSLQLRWAVQAFESEAELIQYSKLFYQTYYVILYVTKGYFSQTQWLAKSPPDYLQDMYKMYRLLFSLRGKIPPLPNFGHHHPSLKN